MRNNKGLTLVELLAVIILLGILSTIASLAVVKIKKQEDEKNTINMISGVLTGAKNYATENFFDNDKGVSVEDIVSARYTDIDNENEVINAGTIKYEVCENNNKRAFYITLNGYTYNDCGCEEQASATSSKLCVGTNETTEVKVDDIPKELLR